MPSSTREVFQLAGPDAEDYLTFGNHAASSSAQKQSSIDVDDFDDFNYDIPRARKGAGKGKKASKRAPIIEDDIDYRSVLEQFRGGRPLETSAAQEQEVYTETSSTKKIPTKQVAEHQQLLLCLQRYAASDRFSPMLRNAGLKLSNLENKSVAELKELQTRVRTVCSSGGGANGWLGQGILLACGGVEKITDQKVPKHVMDLNGFQSSLRADPEYDAVCEMIELDMGWAASMTPMQRLGLCLGKHAYGVNTMNQDRNKLLASLIAQQQKAVTAHAVAPPGPVSASVVAAPPSLPIPTASALSMYADC